MKARFIPYTLHFRFPAGTSRGFMHEKKSWFIVLEQEGVQGIGEAGPLAGLSPDLLPEMDAFLHRLCKALEKEPMPGTEDEALALAAKMAGPSWPSVRFALETAFMDLLKGGKRILFNNAFSRGEKAIPINGLIWMGEKESMQQRMQQKLNEGFSCLKMKIGAIHFEQECAILAEVRQRFSAQEIMLRVDANGAFKPEEALRKLELLAKYELHSIEQPIRAGQPEAMRFLCRASPIPIALDEELIGLDVEREGEVLLDKIQPAYLILKPGLLGGFAVCRRWIELAEERRIGWWITSALESNIGLSAISQFTANYVLDKPQGLGTGQLYHNNIPSPLSISGGSLHYEAGAKWDLKPLEQ